MTYWVVAKIQSRLYMTADVRASFSFPFLAGESYTDGSKKLFFSAYQDVHRNRVRIGICTAGFASNSRITMAKILDSYIKYLEDNKLTLRTSKDVILNLRKFLIDKGFASLMDNTNFGVGMYFNGQASISGWLINSQGSSPEIFINGVEYLEASFSANCLLQVYGMYDVSVVRDRHPDEIIPNYMDFIFTVFNYGLYLVCNTNGMGKKIFQIPNNLSLFATIVYTSNISGMINTNYGLRKQIIGAAILIAQCNQVQDSFFTLQRQSLITPPYATTLSPAADALGRIMLAARHGVTQSASMVRTISSDIDIISMSGDEGGVFCHSICPKHDIRSATFVTPLSITTDRTEGYPSFWSRSPAALIDIETALRPISTRTLKQ